MGIIDSHAHLDDDRFDYDREEIIDSLHRDGVDYIINPGSDLKSSQAALALAEKHDEIFACIGTHPHEAKFYNEETRAAYEQMAKNPKVVAIGEIGLDYYYDLSEREIQKKVFIDQIDLAKKLKLPIVIHSRDAVEDTMKILFEYANDMKVMLHAFSESVEIQREYIKRGFYISMGGVVTFKNAKKSVEAMKEIPLEKLLLETDSPYLTPHPYRGRRNEPKNTLYVAQKIAELKGVKVAEVIEKTSKNAKEFFSLNHD